jgi:hypothetical protein
MMRGKSTTVIWTAAARQFLFERLVAEFGPYSEWTSSGMPGRGLDQKYIQFLDAFATVVGATSGKAVKHQVAWAMPIRKLTSNWTSTGHARTAILATAAALHAGFITQGDLPDTANLKIAS